MEQLRITVDGKVYEVTVERTDGPAGTPATQAPQQAAPAKAAAAPAPAPAPVPAAAEGDSLSPLAGIVQSLAVEVGATVSEGDLIMTLEAMKMYTPVNAETSGTVKAIHVKAGDAVDEGQALYTIG